jgi:hypothetical protein
VAGQHSQISVISRETSQYAFFVRTHQAAVSGDIRRQNRRKPSFHAIVGSKRPPRSVDFRPRYQSTGLLGDGQCPSWVKGRCGRQADGTAGLPPAPEMPVGSGTYASCQQLPFHGLIYRFLIREAPPGRQAPPASRDKSACAAYRFCYGFILVIFALPNGRIEDRKSRRRQAGVVWARSSGFVGRHRRDPKNERAICLIRLRRSCHSFLGRFCSGRRCGGAGRQCGASFGRLSA